MAEEDILITNTNEYDMDYLEMDSPEPEPLDYFNHESRSSQHNVQDVDDLKSSDDGDNDTRNKMGRRSSYTMNNESRALMKQFEATINELEVELGECRDENEKLMVKNETLIIEYDSKIDELNLEIDEMQIESQQYQLRYSEINEELHELRSAAADKVSSTAENRELLIRLQNKEQNEMDLMIDLETANKQNERLKLQIGESSENTRKLQKMVITIKKDKSSLESSLQSFMDKYDTLSKQSRLQIINLTERLDLLRRENEIYRQSLSTAEQEKQMMQNDFTEATMELLHDELNDAHNDINEDVTSLRLARVSSSDFNVHHHQQSIDPESPIPSSFVKQRYGSQTSLPDESLLATLHGDEYLHHSRKSSMDSRLGQYDQMNFKQDMRDVINDIMINDIKTIIKQEINNNENQALNEKMEQLLKMTMDRRKKSIDLNKKEQEKEEEKVRLNIMIKEFEESISSILKKEVIQSIISSKNDRKEFEDKMNIEIASLMNNMNNTQEMNDVLKETISNQMTVFQIALENEIENAVETNMIHVFNNKINTKLRENIKTDINECLDVIRDIIASSSSSTPPQMNKEDDNIKEMISSTLNDAMKGKIDGFMDSFRKEVVPEVEAVFEQLSNERRYNDDDDEKANSNNNELILINDKLKEEIDALQKEKCEHEQQLKNAATSKVHQVVKLQNLLDHMRNDNRLLQYKLEKYQEKFMQIKQQQNEESNNNMVNKVWGYFNYTKNNYNNPSSHLST